MQKLYKGLRGGLLGLATQNLQAIGLTRAWKGLEKSKECLVYVGKKGGRARVRAMGSKGENG